MYLLITQSILHRFLFASIVNGVRKSWNTCVRAIHFICGILSQKKTLDTKVARNRYAAVFLTLKSGSR